MFIEKEIQDSFYINYQNRMVYSGAEANRLTYHRMLLVSAGKGSIWIDEKKYKITGREIFLMAKGQVFYFEDKSHVTGYVISFGDCFWEKAPASSSNCKAVLFNNAAANQRLEITPEYFDELTVNFNNLFKEFEKPVYVNKIDALAAFLKIIMIKVANINAANFEGPDTQENLLYRKFLELLSTSFKSYHEVSDYAQLLGITTRHLSELTKKSSGKGAKDLIAGQIIAEAKRSLLFSANPVKEIAYQLNFSSPEQFSHFFKRNTTFSPLDYRTRFVSIGM
jgi:AraC-like DNA-binding protein